MRYGVVGTGSRAGFYLKALTRRTSDQLVAWSDPNPGRLEVYERRVLAAGVSAPARFDHDKIAEAVREHALDRVIITAPDRVHAAAVVSALEGGADVIVEKPLTTDEEGVRAITDAVRRTGRDVVVTFNYRYSPRNSALREVIASGQIGQVTSLHFEWLLDTAHGADYFRRWHRDKANSGWLLVHKSSHHFDLVNWWLGAEPVRVYASGGLRFYGDEAAARHQPGQVSAFRLDLSTIPSYRELYLEQEHHDGYRRNQDVFGPGITIEDNLSLVVDYTGGATMSYSLNAHAPWEGYAVGVNGTLGRAELTVVERGSVTLDEGGHVVVDPSARPDLVPDDGNRPVSEKLVVQKHFGPAVEVPIPEGTGGHGGGDASLSQEVFGSGGVEDPLKRAASWRDGVRSVVVGIAANRSLSTGQAVAVADLAVDWPLGRG
jgi:predicted dehydrogenase